MRTRIEPIDRDIALIISEELSPAAQGKALAKFARDRFEEAEKQNTAALGYTPTHDTYVDGARSTDDLGHVKADSRILFEFDLINDLFAYVDLQLITHAPVRLGRFRASFKLFADGVEVDPLAPTPDATEFVYVNVQPYSRKIERGLSRQAPEGVFQAVAVLAAKRFGNVAKIRFSYRTVLGGQLKLKPGRRDTDLRQPAIVITR